MSQPRSTKDFFHLRREKTSPEEWFLLSGIAVGPWVDMRPRAVPFLLGHPSTLHFPWGLQSMCS